MRASQVSALLCAALLLLAGCDDSKKPAAQQVRPVRAITVEPREISETISHVGEIQARSEIEVGFRIQGKITARAVDVGAEVKKGDLLARLDDAPQRNRLRSAEAALAAAVAEHNRAETEAARQESLLKNGYTTKQRYETTQRDLETAQAQRDAAQTQVSLARDTLAYAELRADGDGVVTAVYADAGQFVSAGQRVLRLADPNDREAVFGVPAMAVRMVPPDAPVEIALTADPRVRTTGNVRYVSPQADPVTRTHTVRVSLAAPPPEMRLGSTITGSVRLAGQRAIELPAVALFEENGKPAVWVFDHKTGTVSLKPIAVLRYELASVLVSAGLQRGDTVVTAGVHVLRPGQKVRLLAEAGR